MLKRFSVISLLLLIVGLFPMAWGQANTGRLDGTVQDPQGAYLPGVKVEVVNTGTNAKWTTQTDSQGVFIFPVLPVGTYTLTVEAPGFKKFVRENIRVDVAVYASVNVKLEVGGVVEEVTVTSTGEEVISKTSQELTTVISRRPILDMPLVARNPITLATLSAGVTTSGGERASRINGLRQSVINITQDGINVQDNFLRSGDGFFIISSPTVENVEQFSITTSTADASATGSGAVFIRLVTPSGSNEFHGSIFEFHRNTVLNANSFFNNLTGTPRGKLIRNQFGGRASFPIVKNKIFMFTSLDITTTASEVTRNRTVLTAEARRGIFRYRDTSGNIQTVDLFQAGGIGPDPFIQRIITERYPLPNNFQIGDGLVTGGFRWNVPTFSRVIRPSWRVDWRINNTHTAEAIYHLARFDTNNDTLNGFEPMFPGMKGGFQDSWRSTGSFAVRSTFGPNKVNEARFGFQRAPVIFGQEFDAFELGGKFYWVDFPTITDPHLIGITSGRNTSNFQWLDNFAWIRGRHTLRFGGDFRSIVGNQTTNTTGTIPTLTIGFSTANPSPLPTAAFPASTAATRSLAQNVYAILIGQIAGVSQTFNVKDPQSGFVEGEFFRNQIRQRYWGFYFSDSWRARPNLTLNYGIRYEYMTVPDQLNRLALQPVGGEAAYFGISGKGNLFRPGVMTGSPVMLDLASSSNGRKFYNEDLNNFAPSFGFAWSPEQRNWLTRLFFGGPGKGVIRGGYSIAYSLESVSVITNALGNNAGFTKTISLTTAEQGIRGGASFTSLRNGWPKPAVPTFRVPIPQLENFRENRGSGIFGFAENLRTPYVQTWSLSYGRELTPNLALEISYVGNRGVKLWRGIDLNEVNIFENGFLQEFLNAQRNLAISRAQGRGARFDNQGLPGQVPLPIFERLFAGRPLSSGFGNSTFILRLDQNEAGELASQLFLNFLNALTGPVGTLPINFFVVNPEAFFSDLITNGSSSNYHSLQVEVRRRFSSGLQFNANYTFGKALTDFEGSSSNFAAFISLRHPRYEYRRASFDTRHRFNAYFIYELPFGSGKRFLNTGGWVDKLFGGWQMSGIFIAYTGQPLSIVSGRGTINRVGRSGSNTVDLVGMTVEDLKKLVKVRKEGSGVFYFDPKLIGPDGRAVPSIFANPQPGRLGSLGFGVLSIPGYWRFDFNLLKRVRITEAVTFEFRSEFFNLFNAVSFGAPTTDINSTNFGRISGHNGAYDPRIVQFGARLNW
jgi:hypothetical protein